MAAPVQLDKAAALVGKSEVTLRRLIKAGKIPFTKEKTLTGFIYMVDPDRVREFYGLREHIIAEALDTNEGTPASAQNQQGQAPAKQAIRIAVAGESGNAHEYWQKKSDLYEERYNQEVAKHSQTREELGVWRGRAEQAQGMLMKLLPAPQEVEVRQQQTSVSPEVAPKKQEGASPVVVALITILSILLVVVVGGIAYLRIAN